MPEVTKWQVDEARKIADKAYLTYSNLKTLYLEAEKDWIAKANKFKALDYQLAEIDGRLKKIPPSAERKTKKQPELTLEQLQAIAAKLGVSITVEEPEEDNEEVITSIMEDSEQC
jgi:hypothetical protein